MTVIRLVFWGKMQILKKYYYLTRSLLVKKTIKYFIGYLYNGNEVKPLNIMLPKTSTLKSYDGRTKWMYFLIEDDDLLEKHNTVWDKVSADIKEEFDSEPVYNKSYLKPK